MQILVVCTANVCRSPSAQILLQGGLDRQMAEVGPQTQTGQMLATLDVASAGVFTSPGASACGLAPALRGAAGQSHRSRQLLAEMLEPAGLVLTATSEHRSAVVRMSPEVRYRTFTLRQAARIAAWLTGPGDTLEAAARRASGIGQIPGPEVGAENWRLSFDTDDPRAAVPPLPSAKDPEARWQWFVGELDAGRAYAPAITTPPVDLIAQAHAEADRHPFRRLRAMLGGGGRQATRPAEDLEQVSASEIHPDDLPDPHNPAVSAPDSQGNAVDLHAQVDTMLRESVGTLLAAMVAVARKP